MGEGKGGGVSIVSITMFERLLIKCDFGHIYINLPF